MSNHCVCDREYDSDSGTMHDYICDWCSCDNTPGCLYHANEINRLKALYNEMSELDGQVRNDLLSLQQDIMRRMCAFVSQSPEFMLAHTEISDAISDSLRILLDERVAAPLHNLFRNTLTFIDGLNDR